MKKRKMSRLYVFIIAASILVVIISIFLNFFGKDKLGEARYNILFEIDKALLTTIIIGGIAKLVSSDFIEVKKNDTKLRKIGIYSIGEGKLDYKQTKIMFGGSGYEYPKELKFCFISGCVFINDFSDNILRAMEHGCNVKILIADANKSKVFLNRTELLCPQFGENKEPYPYINQIKYTKNVVLKIRKIANDKKFPGTIEIRHYIDEYRYAFRIGVYGEKDDNTLRLWANFQPMRKDAVDLSLCVHGVLNEEYFSSSNTNESSSIVYYIDEAFNMLWDKYEFTKE